MKLTIIVICVLLLPIGCVCVAGKTYSEGERTGVVVKIARKGLIWKTWEGTMNLGSASASEGGTMIPTKWDFTAGPETREAIEAASRSGRRCTLRYRQVVCQWPWNGDTDYVITAVE